MALVKIKLVRRERRMEKSSRVYQRREIGDGKAGPLISLDRKLTIGLKWLRYQTHSSSPGFLSLASEKDREGVVEIPEKCVLSPPQAAFLIAILFRSGLGRPGQPALDSIGGSEMSEKGELYPHRFNSYSNLSLSSPVTQFYIFPTHLLLRRLATHHHYKQTQRPSQS